MHPSCALLSTAVLWNVFGGTICAEMPGPLSPHESLDAIEVAPGLKVELVAAEPLIMDPVAFDWGPDGRLWVVEMRDYPNGLTWNQPDDPLNTPGGRVKVLTDTDGDGTYDEAIIFLDGLSYPTGVKVWKHGVLVTAAPEIFFAADTDGDGRADQREVWYEGFAQSNQQHRVNGLAWGLDNWLHVANGDGGGLIRPMESREEVDIRGHDLRLNPTTKALEKLTGRTQCGRYRDDWGNWFGCNNSNPLWHYPLRYRWLKRNSSVAAPPASVDVPIEPGAARIYPASKTLDRFNDLNKANRITSACGPTIYRDDLLGLGFQGNAFICEPVHNLVYRQVLSAKGATFSSQRAESEQESEFFASTDNWSRPVSVRTGPDGALWVADMYRFVIEHPEWIPLDWQQKLEIRAGSDRGRIYRIYPEDQSPRAIPKLEALSNAELVPQLTSPNGTVRDLVHQMLLWREAKDVIPSLRQVAIEGTLPTARLHSLCILEGLGAADAEQLNAALRDSHPGVVRQALRIAAESGLKDSWEQLMKVSFDDAGVALEIAGALGEIPDDKAALRLAGVLSEHAEDPYVTATALSSINPSNLTQVLEAFHQPGASPEILHTLAVLASDWKGAALQMATTALVQSARDSKISAKDIAMLTGLLEGGATLEQIASNKNDHEALEEIIATARAQIGNEQTSTSDRQAALRLIGCRAAFAPESDLERLTSLLSPRASPELQDSIFEALRRAGDAGTVDALTAKWPSLMPSARSKALNLFLSRQVWTESLLQAMEAGEVPPSQIDLKTRQRLTGSKNEAIRVRSLELFSAASSSTRDQVLAAHAPVLDLQGDAAAGKATFAQVCAACHQAEGVGNPVGPDLAALKDTSPEAMLVAILDPNRAVEDKYLSYSLSTKDGAQHFGLIADENATSVNLRRADGSDLTLLRTELASMNSAGISLMPEGLEASLNHQQLADLIAYLGELGGESPEQPVLSARIRPNAEGIIELRASKCRISGNKLAYMEDVDALGWWNSPEDRAEWTAVLDRPGRYRVEWEYSVDPKSAGNSWQLIINGETALTGTVPSTGSWENFETLALGEVDLAGADNKVVLKSKGELNRALLDLRLIRFLPIEAK